MRPGDSYLQPVHAWSRVTFKSRTQAKLLPIKMQAEEDKKCDCQAIVTNLKVTSGMKYKILSEVFE